MDTSSTEQHDSTVEPQQRPRGGTSTLFLWLSFFLFVVYPLSVGPAAWLMLKYPSTQPVIAALYTPIEALCRHSPPFEKALEWYLFGVWRIPFPTY